MSKAKVDKERLLQKIKTLSGSSKCIQRTSKYLYQFYKSSDIIVEIWLQALNTGSDQAKISLFYIANEMLQSKSYGNNYFKKSWKPYLIHSINCIKDSSVNDKILRILNIWIERKVYDKPFVEDLINQLSIAKRSAKNEQQCKEIIMNFDPGDCIGKLKELIYVEGQTVEPIKLHEASINFDEKICKETMKKLKDKLHCNQFSEQLDQNINHLFQLCTMLEEELKIRQKTLDSMINAEIYYETQQKETLVVEDAYRRYGNQISRTKSTLEKHLIFLMDDSGPMDIDDAPSPGKTPPYIHDHAVKTIANIRESPMSYDEYPSASPSISLSDDDDTNMDADGNLDKPYSPTHPIQDPKPITASLSSSEAFKLLTSVFSQSLTKKPLPDANVEINVKPTVFHNTLATPVKSEAPSTASKTEEKVNSSDSVLADAFRLISNLTGIKNIRERTIQSDQTSNVGTTIPIHTTKMSFKTSDDSNDCKPTSFAFNASNFSTPNIVNQPENISRVLYPDMQIPSFTSSMFSVQPPIVSNQMFPIFNNTSQPPPPIHGMFNSLVNNPLAFNMAPVVSQTRQKHSQSPGSCTEDDEDDGGATPTQDETARLNSSLPVAAIFNKNMIPGLAGASEELSKHIQHALNSGALPFNLPAMLSGPPKDNPPPWPTMGGQFSSNNNSGSNSFQAALSMPFSLMNQTGQMRPIFNPPVMNPPATTNFVGPPRAIRTKRPTMESGAHDGDDDSGSLSPVRHKSPWLQSSSSDDEGSGGDRRSHRRSSGRRSHHDGGSNGKWGEGEV